MDFFEYKLTSLALCMGERMKAGIFRPCVTTIPYSQITGALRAKFGRDKDIHAVGYLQDDSEFNRKDYYIYSPRDKVLGKSKVPLQIEFLTKVLGRVFILVNEDIKDLEDHFEIFIGALKSKGFGRCELSKVGIQDGSKVSKGKLNVRIPCDEEKNFNVREVENPVYGYLFKPTSIHGGVYVLSLFEGSEVVCPKFLQKEK